MAKLECFNPKYALELKKSWANSLYLRKGSASSIIFNGQGYLNFQQLSTQLIDNPFDMPIINKERPFARILKWCK